MAAGVAVGRGVGPTLVGVPRGVRVGDGVRAGVGPAVSSGLGVGAPVGRGVGSSPIGKQLPQASPASSHVPATQIPEHDAVPSLVQPSRGSSVQQRASGQVPASGPPHDSSSSVAPAPIA